jgi:hypothetical protein
MFNLIRGSVPFEVRSFEVRTNSRFGPFRGSVIRGSDQFEVRSFSRFGLSRFGHFRGSVTFEVRSFEVRSYSRFIHSRFGHSRFGLSTFSLSRFGLSRFGHSRFGSRFRDGPADVINWRTEAVDGPAKARNRGTETKGREAEDRAGEARDELARSGRGGERSASWAETRDRRDRPRKGGLDNNDGWTTCRNEQTMSRARGEQMTAVSGQWTRMGGVG